MYICIYCINKILLFLRSYHCLFHSISIINIVCIFIFYSLRRWNFFLVLSWLSGLPGLAGHQCVFLALMLLWYFTVFCTLVLFFVVFFLYLMYSTFAGLVYGSQRFSYGWMVLLRSSLYYTAHMV